MGLELLEDAPDTTDIIASIGGGGMISGVITAVKALRPDIRIWGVETEGADAMSQALAAGQPVRLPAVTSISTTLGAPSVSERTLAIVRDAVEEVLVVPDAEAVRGATWAGMLSAALCGVTVTFGCVQKGWLSRNGSSSNTSSVAPESHSESSACSRSASTTWPPRAALMM